MRITDFMKNNIFYPNEIDNNFLPRIELRSDRFAVIDGCKALSEYDTNSVCFCCDGVNVRFRGDGLVISGLDGDISYINGKIISVEFFNV